MIYLTKMMKIKRNTKINFRIDSENTKIISLFLPISMLDDISELTETIKTKYGDLKYGSKTHFIRHACQKLINEEKDVRRS